MTVDNFKDLLLKVEDKQIQDDLLNFMVQFGNLRQKYDRLLAEIMKLISERGYEYSEDISVYDLQQAVMRATNA